MPNRAFYPGIVSRKLPSGLLVVLEYDPYARAAGVVSVVRGGFASDPQDQQGISHLVEHLTFRAVDAKPDRPLPLAGATSQHIVGASRREKLIHYASAQTNCLTSPDAITCYEFAPPSRLSWLIDLEASRLADPLAGVDEAAVEIERRTIASEHQLRDDPRGGAWAVRQMFPSLFPAGHPYARSLAAHDESAKRLTLSHAKAYAAAHFRPDRMTLLVTAPPTTTTLDDIVRSLPPSLVRAPEHALSPAVDNGARVAIEAESSALEHRKSPLPVPQLWLGWPLPSGWGGDGPTEMLLARWAQRDLDLEQLRQEDPHIRSVRVSLSAGLQASALMVGVLLDDGASPERIDQIVAGRVASLWTREEAERDLINRLKATVDTELVLNEPGQLDRAVEQAELLAFNPKPIVRSAWLSVARTLPTSDLAKFAYKNLGQQHRHAVFFQPSEVPEHASPKTSAQNAAARREDDLFAHAAFWDPLELPQAPPPVSQVTSRKLPTGLTVIVAQRKGAAALAWLGFQGGYADADPPLLVELALRTRPEFTDAPKYHALSDRGATRDASIEAIEFQPIDLRPALGLLFQKATTHVQKWTTRDGLDRILAPVNADLDSAAEKAIQGYAHALFGDHPLGRIVSKSDLDRVTHSAVDTWVSQVHNLRNAALVVVGDVDPGEIFRQATELSQKYATPAWVDKISPLPLPSLRPPVSEHLETVITPRAGALTEIRLGCLLPALTVGKRSTYEMFRLAIQERLSSALRFERADGYTVLANVESVRGGTAFLHITTFVDTGDLADALAALRVPWTRWSQHGLDAGEVNVGRWLYVGQQALTFSNAQAVAYELMADWTADAKTPVTDHFHDDPFATDAKQLTEIFDTCKANAVLGLTGNEAAIRKALRQAWPQR